MDLPLLPSDLPPIPHGRTSRRLDWDLLPAAVRDLVEDHLGSPVAEAHNHGAGFTPGFASTLTGEDGGRLFVKAANKPAQGPIASAYAEEARIAALLPAALPATRLLWSHEDDLWVVLGFEAVEGRTPSRPWQPDELDRCLAALEETARVLQSQPLSLTPAPAYDVLPTLVTGWESVAERSPEWPHLAEADALARSVVTVPGDAVIHFDVRDDNLLLTDAGDVLLCDWNWPALGPAWLDTLTLLLGAHGDGLPADDLLAASPLLEGVAADHVDAWLAALCGYFLDASARPKVPSSPYLRLHGRWYAAATWDWLARRRGWATADAPRLDLGTTAPR